MKESRFIAQNKEKWHESEKLLREEGKDPEKLSNLFTQVLDDLSYSRTYYQNRSVRVYLNKIARQYFSFIYGHKKEKRNRFLMFWKDELPQVIIFCRKQMLISLIVFLAALAIGVFSSVNDPDFASSVLGDSYVEMTKANIEKGDPMAVYKSQNQMNMFLSITYNNLRVTLLTYVSGIFFSIGAIIVLISNGVMVGCFQYFFIEQNLFAESALTIWLHGTLEISSIIIAGGAGLTLGSGIIFPGTYSRLQAFQISAMRSLKLLLGVAPIIVLAAIIESFLTRYTEVPDSIRLTLIVASALFIIGYFIIYPWMKSKSGFEVPLVETKLPPSIEEPTDFTRTKNNGDILKDTFSFYKRNGTPILKRAALVSAGMALASFFFTSSDTSGDVEYSDEWLNFWYNLGELITSMVYALKTPSLMFVAINTLGTSVILYGVMQAIDNESFRTTRSKTDWKAFLQLIVICSSIYFLIYLGGYGAFMLSLLYVFILLYGFVQLHENINIVSAFGRAWSFMFAAFGQVFGLQVILLLTTFCFMLVLSAPVMYFYQQMLNWNFSETDVWSKGVIRFIELYIQIFTFNLLLPVLAAAVSYQYFSLREIFTGEHLRTSISLLGRRSGKFNKR